MAVLFTDNFNRPDGVIDNGWVEVNGGTHSLAGSQLNYSGRGAANPVFLRNSIGGTISDVIADTKQITGAVWGGVFGRYQNASNWYGVVGRFDVGYWALWKYVGAVLTELGTYGVVGTTFGTLKLSTNGSAIQGFVNGTLIGSVNDANLTTEGTFGVFSHQNVDGFIFWDNFEADGTLTAVGYRSLTGVGI